VGRLRLAVLGMGVMGTNHAIVYQGLAEAQLAAAVETSPERADDVRNRFGVPVFGSVEQLIAEAEFDAASICLPDQAHVEPALALAKAGKHLLVEKPLATTLAGCNAIISAAESAGVKLMVGFTLRFDPRYYSVHEAVSQGEIGEPVYMYARRNNLNSGARRLAGRVTLPFFLQVHDIDAMRWMGGAEVTRVYACGVRKVLNDLGVDDAVVSTLQFSDGSIGCVESNWILPDSLPGRFDFRLEVVGTKGRATIDLESQGATVHNGQQMREVDPMFRPVLYGQQPLVLREELHHFVKCVLEDKTPVVGGADGRAATAVALAIEESLRLGQPVDVKYS